MAGYNVIKTQRALPIGSVQPWGGNVSEIPSGWLLCNGAEIEAADYPLLARILRDTYGGTNFDGDFPNYTGTFRLPQTNNKALADISTEYFGTYVSTSGSVPSPIDSNEALTVVEEFIGDSEPGFEPGDLGPPTSVNAVTDLNFTYTPDPNGTIVSITSSGTAPSVTTAKLYKLVEAVAGTNSESGSAVAGTGAKFTVVLNTDGTYDVVPKDKGQDYVTGDQLTILGSNFSADGGTSTANDISIIVAKTGTSAFDGIIEGQKIIKGFGIKEVFVIPRKLGRSHFPQHVHEGTYPSTNVGDAGSNPGRGVTVFATPEVSYTEFYNRLHPCPDNYLAAPVLLGGDPCPIDTAGNLDCVEGSGLSIGWYFGDSPSSTYNQLNNSPFTAGIGRYAIASVEGTPPIKTHRPYRTSSTGHGVAKSWFTGSGAHWNLRNKVLDSSGNPSTSANGDTNMTALKNTGILLPGYVLPFSDSATGITSTNYDPGANGNIGSDGDAYGITQTLFNHAGISFTNDTPSGGGILDVIESHDHDGSFNVKYIGDDIDVTEQISVKAQPNVVPDSLTGALQINFITRVASVTITNLIRAY